MKILSILFVSLIISSSSLYAQSIAEKNAPSHIIDTFNDKFPTATAVRWTDSNDGQWEAAYKVEDVNYWSTYAKNGHWRETKKEIAVSDLKLNVIAVLNKKYDNYSIKTAKLIETKDGNSFDINIEQSGNMIGLIVNSEGKITEHLMETAN